jgi:hypothetical protein
MAIIENKALLVSLLIFFAAVINHAQTLNSPIQVKLIVVDNKTTFRIGEPIRVVLEFTSDAPGYTVDTVRDTPGFKAFDTISIVPDTGVYHWLDHLTGGPYYAHDLFIWQKLSATPIRLPITLNSVVRFDQPGRYTVKIRTRRVNGPGLSQHDKIGLTTNEISFEVVAMGEEEEQAGVKRLSSLLDAKHDYQTDELLTQELAFLTGEPSTREKVRRLLDSDNRNGIYVGNIHTGLYIARNRQLVIKLLENAIGDVNRPINSTLLTAVSGIRYLQEYRDVPLDAGPRYAIWNVATNPELAAVQNSYLAELALGLRKRNGTSLSTTALTILAMAPKDTLTRARLIAETRRVLVQRFSSLDYSTKDELLRKYWDDIRDPALVGHLKLLLADNSPSGRSLHQQALKRLVETWPDEARPFVIEQICDLHSDVRYDVLSQLSDKSLWEVDFCLVGHLRWLQSMIDSSFRMTLERKPALLPRYATKTIYPEVLDIYRESSPYFTDEIYAAILAYLAKQNEAVAIPLIEQRLERITPDKEANFLPKLVPLYYSEGIGKVLKKRLDATEPYAVSIAAYLLGKYGSVGDEAVLLARLERWQKEWGGRITEANTNFQGLAERELVDALINGTAWTLSPARKQELRQNCLSAHCKQSSPNTKGAPFN